MFQDEEKKGPPGQIGWVGLMFDIVNGFFKSMPKWRSIVLLGVRP